MFCHKCGSKLPESALFCRDCGTKVLIENSVTQSSSDTVITDRTLIKERSSTYPDNVNERTEQAYDNEKQDKGVHDDTIKPYYREQFERIASGEKPKFNWAALFLNGWIQLYHGCTGIFCKTFLPLLIALFIVELVSMVGVWKFNFTLLSIALVLGIVVSIGGVALSIINGFKFNKWYYQDVVSNPGKTRSRKEFWILLISEILMALVMTAFSYVYILKLFSDNFTGGITDYEVTDTQTEYEIDSYTITDAEDFKDNNLAESFIDGNNSELTDYKMAYAQKIQELAVDDTMLFSLIYLTGSDIPELVVEHSGYDVSVFAWVDGKIITLMDQWPYGAGGNTGYEYLPGKNIIRNYDMDHAGAVIYESYFTVNDDYEVVELLDEGLSIWYFRDANGDGMIDEDEYCDEPIYYYGDSEISEEEYASYQVRGDYEVICGEMSTEEILAQLDEDKSDIQGYISDDNRSGYYEPIENYWKLSGSYSDNTGGFTLSLSIYSSQEEGEREIGTADIYANNGQHYAGAVTPVEKKVYKIATDTGEEVL